MVTREEIDAIFNAGTPKTNGVTKADIDAIFDAGSTKQATAPVSSPKPKANADLLAYAERVSQSAKRDAEKAKINEEKAKRENAIATAREKVAQATDSLNKGLSSAITERKPLDDGYKPSESPTNMQFTLAMMGRQGLTEAEKEAAMQKFAQPGYKLNKEEKKLAREINKEMYKDLDKELRADKVWQKDYQGSADPISRAFVNVAYGGAHSPEGEKLKTMRAVANKTNPYLSYASGLADSLHLDDLTRMQANALLKATGSEERLTDNDVLGLFGLDKEASKTQNPVASGVGNMAGTLTGYMAGSEAMKNIPAVAGVTGKAGGAVGKGAEKGLSAIGLRMADTGGKGVANVGTKLITGGAQKAGQAIGQGASNILGDTMLDVALDTVPNALDDAKSGLSAKEVTTNALKNVGSNLAWNVAGEGLVQGLPKLGKVVGNKKKVVTNLPELEQLGKDLNPLADARKVDDLDLGAVEQTQKQAVDKIEELSEQIPKIADDVPAEKVDDIAKGTADEFDELAVFTNPIEVKKSPYDVADFKKYKVNNHDSMSSDIDKIVGMYGDDAAKIKAIELKQSINRVLEENSDEAWEEAIQKATELDNALKGKKYQYKRTNKKHKGYRSESMYKGEIVSLFNTEADDIAKEALENASKRTSSMAESSGLRNPELTIDAKKVGSNVPPASVVDGVSDNTKISKFRTNTMLNSEIATKQELDEVYGKDFYRYTPIEEKTSVSSARGRVAEDEVGWYEKYAGAEDVESFNTAQDADTMMLLFTKYNKQAREAKLSGDDALASELYGKARTLTQRMRARSTNAGQFIESLKKYKHTADGAIFHAEKIAADNVEDFVKNNPKLAQEIDGFADSICRQAEEIMDEDPLWKELSEASEEYLSSGSTMGEVANNVTRSQIEKLIENELAHREKLARKLKKADVKQIADSVIEGRKADEIAKTIDSFAMGGTGVSVSDETIDRVVEIFEEAEKYDFNSKKRVELEGKAYSLLASEVCPRSSFMEKWDAWRYLAMLGNTRTHGKNILGNISMNVVSGIKNNVAALIESTVGKVSGGKIEKSKSVLVPIKDKALTKACEEDATNKFYRQLKGNKYLARVTDSIESEKAIYKNRLLEGARKLNESALESEDFFFKKKKYSSSLSGYLKANGADETIFSAGEKLERLKEKRALTLLSDTEKQQVKELEKQVRLLDKGRTYAMQQAEESTFQQASDLAEQLSNFSYNMMHSDKLRNKVMGTLIEGTVPFKKTPINIVKTGVSYSPLQFVKNFADISKLRKGTMSASEYIDNLSKGLTGTGIMVLGGFLANNRIITASQDSETDNFDKNQGKQAYSINIGGKSYTIDWTVPAALPMFVGAELQKALEQKGYTFDDLVNAISNIAQPIMETSMLDGLNSMLETVRYSDDEDNLLASVAGQAATSYLKQGVPTLLGQVARTVDNTRRSTYTDKQGIIGTLDRQWKGVKNKLPGLSMTSEPYVDMWGREQKNLEGGNALTRGLYQTLSPGYLQNVNETPVDSEVQRLYDATKIAGVLPKSAEKKIDDVRLTEQEYTQFAKAKGQAQYDLLQECLNNANYDALSDEDKAEVVKNMYNLASKIGASSVKTDYTSSNKLYAAYMESGAKGAVDYAVLSVMDEVQWVPVSSKTNAQRFGDVESMDLSDAEKGKNLRLADNSEVTERVYSSFGNSDEAVYTLYKLNDMALNDDSNKSEKGESVNFTSSSDVKKVKYLDMLSISKDEKGKYIYNTSSSDKVKLIASEKGYGAVYDYLVMKEAANTDGKGLTRDELKAYLDANVPVSERWYWFEKLKSNKNTKNPY